ncbi:SRPBCC family protein [Arthrobacter sp. ISL-30]|uniref:SRPBCC family protein n=1 Tax=Arthrobacter sp. ISL-30 TaxID=2819109 RepID=UPI001BE737F6|nr:SRPBCC family protein [Arthrobacter sp. ISL-30]MBT2512533.1 SRPBCC family protein [Arthrobacter sp. ISL-30]
MNQHEQSDLDLTISRIIKAPRSEVWSAWTDPAKFEQWFVPAPARCKVVDMELRPGGSFVTILSEDGGDFVPHINGCILACDEQERIAYTTALVGGWRPAENPFITAVITFKDHPQGTEYSAQVMHRNVADRKLHEEMGFYDGWGTVIEQLARLAEQAG